MTPVTYGHDMCDCNGSVKNKSVVDLSAEFPTVLVMTEARHGLSTAERPTEAARNSVQITSAMTLSSILRPVQTRDHLASARQVNNLVERTKPFHGYLMVTTGAWYERPIRHDRGNSNRRSPSHQA